MRNPSPRKRRTLRQSKAQRLLPLLSAQLPESSEKKTEIMATRIGSRLRRVAERRAEQLGVTLSHYLSSLVLRDAIGQRQKVNLVNPISSDLEEACHEALIAEAQGNFDHAYVVRVMLPMMRAGVRVCGGEVAVRRKRAS